MKIKVEDVGMIYPSGKRALSNVSIEMTSPNLIGLLGPNGAGKSTLMKLLVAGLIPTEGNIMVDGNPLLEKERELKKELGYLPQTFGLYDELTVYQFLDYMCALKGIKDSDVIYEVLEKTNLVEKRRIKIGNLSGGQRQRVGIAQAFLGNPKFMIFDEPTVGLDPEERINFRNLFSEAAQDKIVLLSTHIIEDVQSVCNRLIVINLGKILFDGSPQKLIQEAAGHVGVFEETENHDKRNGFHITNRVNTVRGISCRIVAEKIPDFATLAEPTLEDAYIYLISKEEK